MNTRILIWEVEKTIQTCKSLVCNKLWYTLIIFPQAKQQYWNNKKNYCVCAAAWEFILPAAWYIITVVVCTLALLWCMLIKYSCQPNNTYIIWSNHYGTTTATALHACCIDYRICFVLLLGKSLMHSILVHIWWWLSLPTKQYETTTSRRTNFTAVWEFVVQQLLGKSLLHHVLAHTCWFYSRQPNNYESTTIITDMIQPWVTSDLQVCRILKTQHTSYHI